MSSQEHFHYYGKWWITKSTIDHVLQVARCFLPHRFKRSFTITNIPLISLQSGIGNWSNMDGIMNSHWFSLVFCILIQTCYLWRNMDKRNKYLSGKTPQRSNLFKPIFYHMKERKHSSKKTNKQVCLRLIFYWISILNRGLEMVNPEMRSEGSTLLQQINYQPQKKFN